jgi:hypothetical protein
LQLPKQTGTRTVFRAWQPCTSSQAHKHDKAVIAMGRPLPHPRSHP